MSQTRVVTQERSYDFLYDRHYQVSGDRDHARASYAAIASGQQIVPRSNFDVMFSELRHRPRMHYVMNNRDSVPRFVSRHWHGIKQNNDQNVQVGGQDRFRYFRRPIIPYASQLPPDVVLAAAEPQNLVSFISHTGDTEEVAMLTNGAHTVACQTDYRDSEAQTLPYTPDYVVRPGDNVPEVLTLASLTHASGGLPGGLHAVEMLERARHRRAMEAELPPLSDFSQSEKRRKMMDAIETEEWRVREQQIEELQQLRLGVLIKLLKKREEAHQEMSNQRLDRLWNRKQKEKELKFRNWRLKHVKVLRQLMKRFKNVENKLERRDIIREYGDSASQTLAPLTRIGQFLDKPDQNNDMSGSHYLSTYTGLMELEQSLPDFSLNPRIKAPQNSKLTKAGFKKRKYREQDALDTLYDNIKETVATKDQPEKPLRFLEKIEKPIPRPPTPTIEVPNSEEEDQERHVIFIQQLLRGRAVQAMMFEGKEKRKELIEELRSTHSLLSHEQSINKAECAKTLNLQRQRLLLEHREEKISEELSILEGESMGEVFEFLSKELVRLQEERRTHAIFMQAERERRIREAEESGLRQVEERRRREHDEMFKQVIKVHQTTVDQYLNEVIQDTIDLTASSVANSQITELAKKVNDKAYKDEENNTLLQQEEIVGDLIHNFLIPEVHKQAMQENVIKKQHKFLNAAHREIVALTEEVSNVQPEPNSSASKDNEATQTIDNEEVNTKTAEEPEVVNNDEEKVEKEEDEKLDKSSEQLDQQKEQQDSIEDNNEEDTEEQASEIEDTFATETVAQEDQENDTTVIEDKNNQIKEDNSEHDQGVEEEQN